jgi:hypothetical protein
VAGVSDPTKPEFHHTILNAAWYPRNSGGWMHIPLTRDRQPVEDVVMAGLIFDHRRRDDQRRSFAVG